MREHHSHSADPKLTRNQSLVLQVLSRTSGPMSAYDLLGELRDEGLKAPLQIYRALDKLMEQGLAHRLESLNAFVACAGSECHRQGVLAFAICEQCGLVREFADEIVRGQLDGWAETEGFSAAKTTIEMRGTCAKCAVGTARA